jgi:branched-chain amino acid transport system substrate-binding protein
MVTRTTTLVAITALAGVVGACGAPSNTGSSDKTTGSSEKKVVKVGLSAALSGATAYLGQDSKRGIELAIDTLNQDGSGISYELATADDECSPQGGASAYGKLIDVDRVDVVLGSPCSGATLGGMPILQRGQVPGMTFGASNATIADKSGVGGNKFSWRMNIDDAIMGEAFSKLIAQRSIKSASILTVNNDFGRGAAEVYKKLLPQNGVTVGSVETYEYQASDLRPQLTKIAGQKVDALILFGEAPNCALTLRNKKEIGLDIPVFSRSACTTEEALKAMKDPTLGNGVTEVSYWSGTEKQPMIAAFQKKYGDYPPYNAAMAYYGMQVIAQAVKAGGASREKINAGLAKVNWQSPIGPIKFDDHHQGHHDMFVLTIEGGKIVVKDQVPTS